MPAIGDVPRSISAAVTVIYAGRSILGELAGLLQNAGDTRSVGPRRWNERRWADAITNLRKASEWRPSNAVVRFESRDARSIRTATAKVALEQFEAAVRLSPGLAKGHFCDWRADGRRSARRVPP